MFESKFPTGTASTAGEIDEAFATLRKVRAGGLVLSADTFFTSRAQQRTNQHHRKLGDAVLLRPAK